MRKATTRPPNATTPNAFGREERDETALAAAHGQGSLTLVVVPKPHRIALEAPIRAILGRVQPHIGAAGLPVRGVAGHGAFGADAGG